MSLKITAERTGSLFAKVAGRATLHSGGGACQGFAEFQMQHSIRNAFARLTQALSPTEIVLPKPVTTAQENLLENVSADANMPPLHDDLRGPPFSEDRHQGEGAAPHQGSPHPTKPLPPSRPHNTHAVPYLPTDPAVAGRGDRSLPFLLLLVAAAFLACVWATP